MEFDGFGGDHCRNLMMFDKPATSSAAETVTDSKDCLVLPPPPEIQCFGCRTCGCEFEDQSSLNIHIDIQHHRKPRVIKKTCRLSLLQQKYVCAICKKHCVTQLGMIKHLNDKHLMIKNDESQQQSIELLPHWDSYFNNCKKIVDTNNCQVKQNKKQVIDKNKYPRNNLLIELKIKWAKKLWLQLLNCRRLNCLSCYKTFGALRAYNTKAALQLHLLTKHAKKNYLCNYCSKQFKYVYQLQLHKNIEHR